MLPIDMQKMKIDALAFTGHKSLLGPTGIGGMYVREGIEIRHTRAGGTGVRSAVRRHLDEYPYRLEYGTPNMMGIAGLANGVDYIEQHGSAVQLKQLPEGFFDADSTNPPETWRRPAPIEPVQPAPEPTDDPA